MLWECIKTQKLRMQKQTAYQGHHSLFGAARWWMLLCVYFITGDDLLCCFKHQLFLEQWISTPYRLMCFWICSSFWAETRSRRQCWSAMGCRLLSENLVIFWWKNIEAFEYLFKIILDFHSWFNNLGHFGDSAQKEDRLPMRLIKAAYINIPHRATSIHDMQLAIERPDVQGSVLTIHPWNSDHLQMVRHIIFRC